MSLEGAARRTYQTQDKLIMSGMGVEGKQIYKSDLHKGTERLNIPLGRRPPQQQTQKGRSRVPSGERILEGEERLKLPEHDTREKPNLSQKV